MMHEYFGIAWTAWSRFTRSAGRWASTWAGNRRARRAGLLIPHHTLSMIRGVIDLYRATGEKAFLERAEDYLAYCRENRIVSAVCPKGCRFSEQDEGCALADYVRRHTDDVRANRTAGLSEDAERTQVNQFFMNIPLPRIRPSGFRPSTSSGGSNGQGWEGASARKPRVLPLWGCWSLGPGRVLHRPPVRAAPGRESVSCASIDLPDLSARAGDRKRFPRLSKNRPDRARDRTMKYAIRLRVPAWAVGAAVKLNGKDAGAAAVDGASVLDRDGGRADRLDIAFGGVFAVSLAR